MNFKQTPKLTYHRLPSFNYPLDMEIWEYEQDNFDLFEEEEEEEEEGEEELVFRQFYNYFEVGGENDSNTKENNEVVDKIDPFKGKTLADINKDEDSKVSDDPGDQSVSVKKSQSKKEKRQEIVKVYSKQKEVRRSILRLFCYLRPFSYVLATQHINKNIIPIEISKRQFTRLRVKIFRQIIKRMQSFLIEFFQIRRLRASQMHSLHKSFRRMDAVFGKKTQELIINFAKHAFKFEKVHIDPQSILAFHRMISNQAKDYQKLTIKDVEVFWKEEYSEFLKKCYLKSQSFQNILKMFRQMYPENKQFWKLRVIFLKFNQIVRIGITKLKNLLLQQGKNGKLPEYAPLNPILAYFLTRSLSCVRFRVELMQTFDEELTKRTLVKMIGLINEAENERKRIKKI